MTRMAPSGFEWCGACGYPSRTLTDEEKQGILMRAVDDIRSGAASIDYVFQEVGWLAEMHTRGLIAVCDCPPQPPPPWWADAPKSGFHLYRLWSSDGRLLYVGVSTVLRNRLRSHAKRLGELVDRATWEEHPDAASMLRAETEAIGAEAPALNIAKVDPG